MPRFTQQVRARRTWQAHRGARGQSAVLFIVITAMIVVLTSVTLNVGQVVALRTAATNAADAGALAAASWMASGMNEMVDMGQAMWVNYRVVSQLLRKPFCPNKGGVATSLYSQFVAVNIGLRQFANRIMETTTPRAQLEGLLQALANAQIDDPTQGASDKIQKLASDFETSGQVQQNPFMVSWNRGGAAGAGSGASSVTVSVQVGQTPKMQTKTWVPPKIFVLRPCGTYGGEWCCNDFDPLLPQEKQPYAWWSYPFTNFWTPELMQRPGEVIASIGAPDDRKRWGALQQDYDKGRNAIPKPDAQTGCGCATNAEKVPIAPWLPGLSADVLPNKLQPNQGNVQVTVTRTWSGNKLWFWDMKPQTIKASATAEYKGAVLGSDNPVWVNGVLNLQQTKPRKAYAQLKNAGGGPPPRGNGP